MNEVEGFLSCTHHFFWFMFVQSPLLQHTEHNVNMSAIFYFVRCASTMEQSCTGCNDHAGSFAIGFEIEFDFVRIGNFCAYLSIVRVPGYPTVTGIGHPVPKISVNARA